MKLILSLAAGLILANPSFAGEQVDNLGRPVGNPYVLGVASDDQQQSFFRHDWDLSFTLGARGSNNDSGAEEVALASIAAYGYFGSNFAAGVQISKPDLSDAHLLEFAPVTKFYMFRDPNDAFLKGIRVKPITYTLATGQSETLEGGAFSVNPLVEGFVEMPLGFGAISLAMGADYIFTHLSEDPPNTWGDLQADLTFVWWWLR